MIIEEIFVNQGPGNFSGLERIFSYCQRDQCIAKNLNLFGYNTFMWSSVKIF